MKLDHHVNGLYSNLQREESSVVIKIKTENIALHGYLYKFIRAEDL
jgi:hypothetical protein